MANIMITGPVAPLVTDTLSPFGTAVQTPDLEERTLIDHAADAVAIVCRGEAKITRPVIEAALHLRVVGRTGVGVDSIDVAAATERGIPVINTPGANARSVAEGALTLALVLLKEVFHWDRQVRAGNWAARYQLITGDVEGTVLGIVGFGNIGRTLARLALPLGFQVVATDPFVSARDASAAGVTLLTLEELLARADVVSLHATLTADTEGMIDAAALARMKRGARLLNLGRGGLIDGLDILHDALEEGRLGGVALDTFEPEPPDLGHPIFRHERCICSPHVLGLTPGAMHRIYVSMANDMAAVLAGKRPRYCVNPKTLSGPLRKLRATRPGR